MTSVYPIEQSALSDDVKLFQSSEIQSNDTQIFNSQEQEGPYGVNLVFIKSFIKKYKITNDMTTDYVVNNIIVPQTVDTKTDFIEKIKSKPHLFSDLKHGQRNQYKVVTKGSAHSRRRARMLSSDCYFLSHCWQMPFVHMLEMLENVSRQQNCNLNTFSKHTYFWIDVFCKNQHTPTPAMDEFKIAMKNAGIHYSIIIVRAFYNLYCL